MRKRLLMIAAFALTMVGTVSAYNVGDYAYNSTQRFKITGENLVTNGDFANGTQGWCGATADDPADGDTWEKVDGEGPNGENAIKSHAATADKPLCKSWQLEAGTTYIVSIDVKFPTTLYTATIKGGSPAGNNSVDFFLNTNGSFTKAASTEDAPVTNVASSSFCVAEEWTTLVYSFTPAENTTNLVMRLEKLPAEAMVTNIAIHAAAKVYDIRLAQARFAYARMLMADENFTATDDAKVAKETLEGTIATLEEMIDNGQFDDPGEVEPMMEEFENVYFAPFLDASTENLTSSDYFKNIDIVSIPKYNRDSEQTANGATLGGFKFYGDQWWHGDKQDYLHRFILPGASSHIAPGGITLINDKLPAGKYFLSFEVRNGTCMSNWSYDWTYNEGDYSAFLNKDTGKRTVLGKAGKTEGWTRFYIIDELKEGEKFEAGFWWDVADEDPCHGMDVRNFEVRAFSAVKDIVAHKTAYETFKVQYDAATDRIDQLNKLKGNGNYPWGQDSIARARVQWDPYFNPVKAWVGANGEDSGVASTEELNDWALYQNYKMEEPTEESSEEYKAQYNIFKNYAVVRGYSRAIDYIKTLNKPLTDLGDAIDAAKKTRNSATYATGDRDTYKTAILAALQTLKTTREQTTDASREADSQTLATALSTLNEATEAFLASVTNTPIVDIDFAKAAELKTINDLSYYAIAGAAGEMLIDEANFNATDNSTSNWQFQLGVGEEYTDILHVGGGNRFASVTFDAPTDDDALDIHFDMWFGSLGKYYQEIDLQNAAGETVAGFAYSPYNNGTSFNDFYDATTEKGLKIVGQSGGKDDKNEGFAKIVADNNKTTFTLNLNYKNKTVKGSLTYNGNSYEGEEIPMKDLTDNKVVTFRVGSAASERNLGSAHGRRAWFDNLKIFKSTLVEFEEDITEDTWLPEPTGIKNVETVKANDGAIYNLAGQKVSKSFKGLIIKNGKKYFVK